MSVHTHLHGPVAVLTLDRPDKRNAFDAALTLALDAALNAFEDDAALRVAVLTGGTRFFSAGTDVVAWAGEPMSRGGPYGIAGRRLQKPVIAAVEGIAAGGGFEIALSCDLVIAADHVQFALPEMPLGIVPDAGALQRLPRRLPHNIAMEMLLLGRRMGAAEAAHYGLVNKVVPYAELMTAARAWAEQLAKSAPLAMQTVKEVLRAIECRPLRDTFETMRKGELPVYRAMLKSDDAAEGVKAFVEKREPVFKGK